MKKIMFVVFGIFVGAFAIWYMENVLGITIENGYTGSERKGVVMGIAGAILLPAVLVYELIRKILK